MMRTCTGCYHWLTEDSSGLCYNCRSTRGPLWDGVNKVEAPYQTTKPNKRAAILDTAKGYVTKDRQATHGEPEDSFGMIARLWSAYLGQDVHSHDVCSMMAILKMARAKSNPANDENWVDMAGYAACGAEAASVQRGIEMEEGK